MGRPIARVIEAPADVIERVREYLKQARRRKKPNGRSKKKVTARRKPAKRG